MSAGKKGSVHGFKRQSEYQDQSLSFALLLRALQGLLSRNKMQLTTSIQLLNLIWNQYNPFNTQIHFYPHRQWGQIHSDIWWTRISTEYRISLNLAESQCNLSVQTPQIFLLCEKYGDVISEKVPHSQCQKCLISTSHTGNMLGCIRRSHSKEHFN